MQVSIIIPSYNSEGTIRQTLDAVLDQDFKDYEVIVVDDGSEDSTCKVVEEYRVRLVKQKHKGPAAARNLGAKVAGGDILLFTDSDCIAERNWIKEMIQPFEEESIVGVQGRYKTKQPKIVARFAQYEIEERYGRMLKHKYIDFVGSYSAAYRSKVFLNVGGFDESFTIASGEDPDLSFRLASKGYKLVFNPSAIVYHNHPDSIREYMEQKFYRARWRVPLYEKNIKKTITESYTPQVLKLQIVISYLLIISIFITPVYKINHLSFIFLLSFFALTIPLSFRIFKKDKKAGAITPLIVTLRTTAFATGLIYGLFMEVKHRVWGKHWISLLASN